MIRALSRPRFSFVWHHEEFKNGFLRFTIHIIADKKYLMIFLFKSRLMKFGRLSSIQHLFEGPLWLII